MRLGLKDSDEISVFWLVINRKSPLMEKGIVILTNEWLG